MNRHTIPPSAGEPSRSGGALHRSRNILAANSLRALCLVATFPVFDTKFVCCLSKKKEQFISNRGSAVECTFSETLHPSSIPEPFCFCWNGFCARDCFKHSEAKWCVLPSPRQSVLRGSRDSPCTWPTVYNSLTVILTSRRAFFCQSPVASTWP